MTPKAAKNRASYTDANGEYTVAGLASGEDEVQFIGARYVTQYYKNASSLSDASTVTVKAGKEETTSEINAELMAATPPEKVKPPVVMGTVAVGQTLTCSSAWTGTPTPEEFTYRWLKNGATEIAGATKEAYEVTSADERHALACEVTAKNSAGERSAQSPVTQAVSVVKPVSIGRPMVSGTATVGQRLTCSHGTWESFPAGYTYKWLRDGAEISGAVSSAYTVLVADEGHSISCEVTASNSAGPSAPEPSANSDSVPLLPTLPVNIVAPEVAVQGGGAAVVGKTLSCSSGTWTGTPTPTFSYKWLRDGVAIGGSRIEHLHRDDGRRRPQHLLRSDRDEHCRGQERGEWQAASQSAKKQEAREKREAEEALAAKKHPEESANKEAGRKPKPRPPPACR